MASEQQEGDVCAAARCRLRNIANMTTVTGQLVAKLDVLKTMRVRVDVDTDACTGVDGDNSYYTSRLQFSELAKDDTCVCATIDVHESGNVSYRDISGTCLDFLEVPIDVIVERVQAAFASLITFLKPHAAQQEIAAAMALEIANLEDRIKGLRAMQELATQLIGKLHIPKTIATAVEHSTREDFYRIAIVLEDHAVISVNEKGGVYYCVFGSYIDSDIPAGTPVDEMAAVINQAMAGAGKRLSGR